MAEFDRSLEEDLMGDCSGYFKRLMVSQCNGARHEPDGVDDDLAQQDAQTIFDVSVGM